jgi:hypothetical protein
MLKNGYLFEDYDSKRLLKKRELLQCRVGEAPYLFTFTLTSTTLTRHSETLANNQTVVFNDEFTK